MKRERSALNNIAANEFLKALGQGGAIDEQTLSQSKLDGAYDELKKQVAGSVEKQEQLVKKIQV